MLINLDNEILEKYPTTAIGYLVAEVAVKKSDPLIEALKSTLAGHLRNQGIDATNFAAHPSISTWRQIYEENFQVKAKTYRSSIEALVRRVVTGKEPWNICNVVDLYNCCSILSLLPMGGYDLNKVSGDIHIRHAKNGETFLGLGEREKVETKSNHVVYADDSRVICWLWNHKDSAETCIDDASRQVIFFVDSFDCKSAEAALRQLKKHIETIQGVLSDMGILDRNSPHAHLNVE